MHFRTMLIAFVAFLVAMAAIAQDAPLGNQSKPVLRPDLVDSLFCGVRVPIEGTYYVSPNQLIELDVSSSAVDNCGPDMLIVSSDNWAAVKPFIKHQTAWYDSGANSIAYLGSFYKAMKKGEATITIKLENRSAPYTTMTFEYHIVVR